MASKKVNFVKQITSFTGAWNFLSNFYPITIHYEEGVYASVEHAYQAAKSTNPRVRMKFQLPGMSPGQAKRAGRSVDLRPDWEQVKLGIMRELLQQKFAGSIMRRKLISTFGAELVEGNYWHDVYWGVCNGEGTHPRCGGHEPFGENNLGKLLMEIRGTSSQGQDNQAT